MDLDCKHVNKASSDAEFTSLYTSMQLSSTSMGANSAHKHSLPPVNEREVTPLLSPRTHDVSRELVLEEPRANRASARQRDMLTDKGQEDKSTDRLTHAGRC